MMKLRLASAACALLVLPVLVGAAAPSAAIRNVLDQQSAAWNRGDLVAFVATYDEQCTLVGKEITHVTRAQVLAHYREKYPNAAAMGKLNFSNISVQTIDPQVAVVTGQWRLERSPAAGGPVGGVFSLVIQLRGGVWRIVLDHTS
jgi:uncharacterized protein (TIGR02246 family)